MIRLLLVRSLAVVLAAAGAAQADGKIRYFRVVRSIQAAVDALAGRARVEDRDAVLFVFEQADFGRDRPTNSGGHDYHGDLEAWCKAIGAWVTKDNIQAAVALTGSRSYILTDEPSSYALLLTEAERPRLDARLLKRAGIRHVPTGEWLKRLARSLRGKRKPALVYLAGRPNPRDFAQGASQRTREWGHRAVLNALNRVKGKLYVITPEARFHEAFLPDAEIPRVRDAWWTVPHARASTYRFHAWTGPFTDCPSSYGYHVYARTVAATGGAYIFYPTGGGKWLDPCPYDVPLLRELAPELEAPRKLRQRKASDPVLRAVAEAMSGLDKTRRHPPLWYACTPVGEIGRFGGMRKTALEIAAACDRGLAILDGAEKAVDAGTRGNSHRRSLAQLRYATFILVMSAFHLEAWAAAAGDVADFVSIGPGRSRYREDGLGAALWPRRLFKLSDCLPAYDSRKATRPVGHRELPFYRAERPLDVALARVPVYLRERAKRMIVAARDVMKHEARSPWGWMTYYSEVYDFEPRWSGRSKGRPAPRASPSSKKPAETTPREKPKPGKPGSGGGGTTTGGG